jgi:hypothetical protein
MKHHRSGTLDPNISDLMAMSGARFAATSRRAVAYDAVHVGQGGSNALSSGTRLSAGNRSFTTRKPS